MAQQLTLYEGEDWSRTLRFNARPAAWVASHAYVAGTVGSTAYLASSTAGHGTGPDGSPAYYTCVTANSDAVFTPSKWAPDPAALGPPLVFLAPVMDLRNRDGSLLARFDTTGDADGLAEIPAAGQLLLTMPHGKTAGLANAVYGVDVFADVAGARAVILPRGNVTVRVIARITRDDP